MNRRPASSSPVGDVLLPKIGEILYGGDYNPEQWPESVWEEDMNLMRRSSVNLVSIGIFSWAKLQPDEKTYTFGWLDRVMDLLAANHIRADLATGTASPPPWMSRYPDLCAVDEDGHVYSHGSRQHYSPSSPTYRRFASALVGKIAARYAGHPALAAWHINNEYACHVSACHSEASTRAFRGWLRKRYRTLKALNAAWSTTFWSQTYHSWDEVITPRRTPTFSNPSQLLDFRRFSSDALLDLYKMEHEILRKLTPDIPVTTNFMGFFKHLDYWKWAREVDFASWDCYPDPLPGRLPEQVAAQGHDLTRSLKPGRPFVLMEHATSHVHWRPVNATKAPGLIGLWGLQAVARGADGVLFFQWRQSVGGAEKFHGAMVQHGTRPGTGRVFREVCELGADLKKLEGVAGSLIRNRVAIVMDWEAWWTLELPGKPAEMNYSEIIGQFHRYFFEHNLGVDFVAPGADLSSYSLVVAPTLYLLSEGDAENLIGYLRRGGTLLTTCFSGIVDENERVVTGGYPGYLRAALGMRVEEWFALGPDETRRVKLAGREGRLIGRYWTEAIHTDGAEVLATFSDSHLKGCPAFTSHIVGKGRALYLGSRFDDADVAVILDRLCCELSLEPVLKAPLGVEVTMRDGGGERFLFLLNHNQRPARISLGGLAGLELLTGRATARTVHLGPHGAAVINLMKRPDSKKSRPASKIA